MWIDAQHHGLARKCAAISSFQSSPQYLTLSETIALQFWKANMFQGQEDIGPGPLIQLTEIIGHAVRITASVQDTPRWVTIRLNERI